MLTTENELRRFSLLLTAYGDMGKKVVREGATLVLDRFAYKVTEIGVQMSYSKRFYVGMFPWKFFSVKG